MDAIFPGSNITSFKVIGLVHTGTAADKVTAYARLDSASIEGEKGLNAVSWSESNAEILNLLDTQMFFS